MYFGLQDAIRRRADPIHKEILKVSRKLVHLQDG